VFSRLALSTFLLSTLQMAEKALMKEPIKSNQNAG
jgi:hypothetical protein